jgi:translocation and assembly module TamB
MKEFFTRRRWIFSRLLPGLLIFLVIFFLLRGPYLSNSIKRIIIPILENATGERIITDHAVINLLPLYIQIKSIRVFNDEGRRLVWITKTRAYIDPLALLRGEVRLSRLSLKEPNITASKEEIQRMIDHIKGYLSGGREGVVVTLKGIKIIRGEFDLSGMNGLRKVSGRGLMVSGFFRGDELILDWSLDEGHISIKGLSEVVYDADGRVRIGRDGVVELSDIDIGVYGSELRADGRLSFSPDEGFKKGVIKGRARVLTETVNRIMGVRSDRASEGEIRLTGGVEILPDRGWPDFVLDLKTEGFFYLEDLMRLLKVRDRIEGRISLDGRISGSYKDLVGEGRVRLRDGLLSTLPLDDAEGDIRYRNRRFDLRDFIAHTYKGELKGDAYLLIPRGDYFVRASVDGIDSRDFFGFIGWDAPFSRGIIDGEFDLKKIKGRDFDVVADVNYTNRDVTEEGPITRLRGIEGVVRFKDRVVTIKDARFFTPLSEMFMDGDINLMDRKLLLKIRLNSRDASELMDNLEGKLVFTGSAGGSMEDINISGSLQMSSGSINGFIFDTLDSELTYSVDSLRLKRLEIRKGRSDYRITGTVSFRDAERLFSFNRPLFDLKVLLNNADAGVLAGFFYKDAPLSGYVDGTLYFKGTREDYQGRGRLLVREAMLPMQAFDRIGIEVGFSEEALEFKSIALSRGESELTGDGTLYHNRRFKLALVSNRLRLEDVDGLKGYGIGGVVKALRLNAHGSIDNPDVALSMDLGDINLKGIVFHKGSMSAKMKDRVIRFNASLPRDRVGVDGKVVVGRVPEWEINMRFDQGDYGMIVRGVMDVPDEEMHLRARGAINLGGRGRRVLSMTTRFDSIDMALYGYRFKNKGVILIRLNNRRLEIGSFELMGDRAYVSVTGGIDIGQGYDIRMVGHLGLAPLSALSRRVSSLRGEGDVTVEISGRWQRPDITGEIRLKDVTASIKGFPYIIGPFQGSVGFKRDRVVIDSLYGQFAGGRVEVSGVGYLKGLSFKGFSIMSRLDGIRLSHLEGIKAVFDGQLFYESSAEGDMLSGDLYIKSARYERRVEWKGWLTGLTETGGEGAIVETPPFFADTGLNIHISGSEGIMIDNNILRSPVSLDLTITGRVNRYGLIGSVRADDGNIYFRDNEFEIISGRVDFVETGRISPVFNVKAETFTRGYRVRMTIEGPLDRLGLFLSSDPPLSENEILMLLTAGRVDKEGRGFESGIAAGEATAILAGGVEDVFTEGLRSMVGVERFEINPQTTSTGALSPRITVGKRLLNERLSISYTISIGTTEESIIRVKYRIGKKISIIGTRDELGSIGMDLNYRFEFE